MYEYLNKLKYINEFHNHLQNTRAWHQREPANSFSAGHTPENVGDSMEDVNVGGQKAVLY